MGALDGRVALVTGASRGIGRAIALELGRAGAKVALNYRSSEAEARAVAEEIVAERAGRVTNHHKVETQARAIADKVAAWVGTVALNGSGVAGIGEIEREDVVTLAQADVAKGQEARALIQGIVAKWGRIDILVNNAGITHDRTLRKMGDEGWHAVVNNNLNSVFFTTSAVIPVMINQDYGRIINIGSVIGQAGNIGQANYAAAKGGMIAFTKSSALELAKYNITVNVVNPGFTWTDMLARVPENVLDQIKAKIPMARFAKPEEIAKAVLFLACDGDYITGQQVNVNGGLYM